MRVSFRARAGAFLISATTILLGLGSAPAVATQTACPHGGNATSSMCLGTGPIFTGIWGTWHFNNLNEVLADGNHINAEMWGYTQTDHNRWIEGGLREGYYPENPCGCNAYSVFWADFDNTTGTEHRHFTANTSPTGAAHSFEALVQSGTHQSMWYYDYNYQGVTTMQVYGQFIYHQIGLEDSNIGSNTEADLFDFVAKYTHDQSTWLYWPEHNYWIDYNCSSGYTVPNCLTGSGISATEWTASKPR